MQVWQKRIVELRIQIDSHATQNSKPTQTVESKASMNQWCTNHMQGDLSILEVNVTTLQTP